MARGREARNRNWTRRYNYIAPAWTFLFVLVCTWRLSAMAEINFRKIDIDAYDEDAFQEGELYEADPRDPMTVLNDAKVKSAQVRTSLSR